MLENLVDARLFAGALAPEDSLARAPVAFQREPQIVLHRVHVEHGRLLELAADAEFGDLRLVERGEVVRAVEIDVALVGPRLAGDDVHHGGLAGAVRPDDGAHLARLDRERQIVERAEAVERHRDGVEIEQRGWWCVRPWRYSAGLRGPSARFGSPPHAAC